MHPTVKELPGATVAGAEVQTTPGCVEVAVTDTGCENVPLATTGINDVLLVPPCATVNVVGEGVPKVNVLPAKTASCTVVDALIVPDEPWIVMV